MAFNPFHGFRKHQKVFMVGLTVACMFIFVFTGAMSSGWDFFMGVGQVFGYGQTRTDQVATLYSKPVSMPELVQQKIQREIANRYVVSALISSSQWADERMRLHLGRAQFNPQALGQINEILKVTSENRLRARFGQFDIQQRAQAIYQYNGFRNTLQTIQRDMPDKQRMPDKEIIDTIHSILRQDSNLFLHSYGLYFGGSLDHKSLLDFMIWKHQADDLGIHLSSANVVTILNQLTPAHVSKNASDEIQMQLAREYQRSFSPEILVRALGDEFRVQLAQEALLGSEQQFYARGQSAGLTPYDLWQFFFAGAPSDGLTPYELWEFYREQRAENTVVLLPIPVHHADFLNKAGEPTEAELKELYDKNKARLYDPSSEQAGFQQPPRFRLEWVSGSPDSPEIKRATEVTAAALGAIQGFVLAATVADPTANALMLAFQAGRPSDYGLALHREYDNQRYQFQSPSWISDRFLLHDSSKNHPAAIANAVQQSLMAVGTGAPAFLDGWGGYLADASYFEAAGRARAAAKVVHEAASAAPTVALTGALPSGEVIAPLLAAVTVRREIPDSPFLPLEQVKPFVEDKLRDMMARTTLRKAMEQFSKSLTERTRPRFPTAESRSTDAVAGEGAALVALGANSSPFAVAALTYRNVREQQAASARAAATMALSPVTGPVFLTTAPLVYRDKTLEYVDARAKIDLWVKRLGLKHGETATSRDEYDIGEDPGIAPLKSAINRPWGGADASRTERAFAAELARRIPGNLYEPQADHDFISGEEFLFWKTDEKGPYVPAFDEAKEKVKTRWLADKARPLAEEEAKRVAENIRNMKATGIEAVRALSGESKLAGPPIHLDRVAPLVEPRAAAQSRQGRQFEAYRIPESKVEFSSEEMLTKLHQMKAPGDAVVVHDQPRDHYYVAVLERRERVYPQSFLFDTAQPNMRMGLIQKHEADTKQRDKQLESILEQLRAQAGYEVNEERLKESTSGPDAE